MNERIKKILEELGLKRIDFANRLHISQPFASELCSGAKSPSERTISDICREFGVNESWLRTGEGEMFAAPTAASDKIMDFAAEIARNDDKEFRKRLVVMLADLEPKALPRIAGPVQPAANTIHPYSLLLLYLIWSS